MVSPAPSRMLRKISPSETPLLKAPGEVRSVASATTSTWALPSGPWQGVQYRANEILPWAMDFRVYGTGFLSFLASAEGSRSCGGKASRRRLEKASAEAMQMIRKFTPASRIHDPVDPSVEQIYTDRPVKSRVSQSEDFSRESILPGCMHHPLTFERMDFAVSRTYTSTSDQSR